jgi:hypothetical protein
LVITELNISRIFRCISLNQKKAGWNLGKGYTVVAHWLARRQERVYKTQENLAAEESRCMVAMVPLQGVA